MKQFTKNQIEKLFALKGENDIEAQDKICKSIRASFNSLYETGYYRNLEKALFSNEVSFYLAEEYYHHIKSLGFSFKFELNRKGIVSRASQVFYGPDDIGDHPFNYEFNGEKENLKKLSGLSYTELVERIKLSYTRHPEVPELVKRHQMIGAIVGLQNILYIKANTYYDYHNDEFKKLSYGTEIDWVKYAVELERYDHGQLFDFGSALEVYILTKCYASIHYSKIDYWPTVFENNSATRTREFLSKHSLFGRWLELPCPERINGYDKLSDIEYANPYTGKKFTIKTDHPAGAF